MTRRWERAVAAIVGLDPHGVVAGSVRVEGGVLHWLHVVMRDPENQRYAITEARTRDLTAGELARILG